MTSIKLKFRPSCIKGKEGTLYFQIIHNRSVCRYTTEFHIHPNEYNSTTESLSFENASPERKDYLNKLSSEISASYNAFEKVIDELQQSGIKYTAGDICHNYAVSRSQKRFSLFMTQIIEQLQLQKRFRSSETYRTTLRSFMRFRKNIDIDISDISSDIIEDYQAYLRQNGLTMNSISFYMRILRAVYNKAVDKDLAQQKFPFRHVYTGIDRTVKRALPIKIIKQIIQLDLTDYPHEAYARDMFLFSFYTRGMSFIDMAFLQKSALQNDILSYRRRKTGQQLFIKWESCMQEIVNRYKSESSEYLLPIISSSKPNARQQYKNALFRVNRILKRVAVKVELTIPLSMYVARHSWASIAHSKNIPISIISEGMGHDSESTTQIYLASLDTSLIDKANAIIIKSCQ